MMRRWLLMAPLLCAAPAFAQGNCTTGIGSCSTATGSLVVSLTVGRIVELALTATSTALDTPTIAAYNAGFVASTGPSGTVRANGPWTLAISSSAATWTGVDTQTEAARPDKPSTDLQWSTTANGTFVGITTTPAPVGTGTATNGTSLSLFYQTRYAWTLDTPGNYSLQVVFTLTAP